MSKLIKIILKALGVVVLLAVLILAFLIVYATITDYKPDEEIVVFKSSKEVAPLADSVEYNLMIWNIGYCGLGDDMDFFYDGGKQVRTSKDRVAININGVKKVLADYAGKIDFFMLQEVDFGSKRSWWTNQLDSLQTVLPDYMSFVGTNYKVFFVPTPPAEPFGKVNSGLVTFSKHVPIEVVRHQFPGNYGWPKGLFMLDRCFLVARYPLSNGKQLLVINTHNSAYDDGSLRKGQMEYLKNFLTNEYNKGNYVIVGGDWNQCPPNFSADFDGYLMDTVNKMDIPSDYISGWKWVFQNKIPTNRRVDKVFDHKTSKTTVIDFYLVSPNISNINIKAIDLEFKNSDHQPVVATFKLTDNSKNE